MKKAFGLIVLVFIGLCNINSQTLDELDSSIESLLKKHNIKGIGYVAIKDGKTLVSKGFGYANQNSKLNSKSSLYIASNTKAFVGLAMAQLIQKKLIKLDFPITEYIDKKYFPEDIEAHKITVKHLISHTHGLSNDALNFRTAYSGEYPNDLQKLLKFTKQRKTPISHEFRYSNFGYLLSGIIIENVTGKNWKDYLESNILKKLKMKNTRPYMPQNSESMVLPYSFTFNQPLKIAKKNNTLHAAGGLFSTLDDMGKWLSVFTVKDSNLPKVYQNLLVKNADRLGPFEMVGYGFGWTHGKLLNDNLKLHFGTFSGYHSVMSYMPDKNLGFFVFVNEKEAGLQVSLMLTSLYYNTMNQNPAKNQINSLFSNIINQTYKNYKPRSLTTLKYLEIKGLSGAYISRKYGSLKITKCGNNYEFHLGNNLKSLGYKGKKENEIIVEFSPGLYESFFIERKNNSIAIRYDEYNGDFYPTKN